MFPKQHIIDIGDIKRCQICGSDSLHLILNLGKQPLCNSFLSYEMLGVPEDRYPLRMCWCYECALAQLDYFVDPKIIYNSSYSYRTGSSKEIVNELSSVISSLISRFKLGGNDLVVDIGSNDGYFLNEFKRSGVLTVGVEPTDSAKDAMRLGIDTFHGFFDLNVADAILQRHGQASLITAVNLFERVASFSNIIDGIERLLRSDGVLELETHYLLDVIQGSQFDAIYHEHVRIFSLRSLIKLFSYYNFTVFDAEKGNRYRDNIRIYVAKGRGLPVSDNVANMLRIEDECGLNDLVTYTDFSSRARAGKNKFVRLIDTIKAEGKSVVANSCPGRAVSLLNFYEIDKNNIEYIVESPSSTKVGKYIPGLHIPIISNEVLESNKPDYIIILAWHYAENIIDQLSSRGIMSDFIIPLPDLRIVKSTLR